MHKRTDDRVHKIVFPESYGENRPERSTIERYLPEVGFKAVQIGPLTEYVPIEGEHLKSVLDSLNMERDVHVGGIYDAERLALTEEEYAKVQKQIRYGIMLSKKISSTLVSVHPPFFATENKLNKELLLKARTRFLKLLKEEAKFASNNHIKICINSISSSF